MVVGVVVSASLDLEARDFSAGVGIDAVAAAAAAGSFAESVSALSTLSLLRCDGGGTDDDLASRFSGLSCFSRRASSLVRTCFGVAAKQTKEREKTTFQTFDGVCNSS